MKVMTARQVNNNNQRRMTRLNDYPERQVGFPERNDVTNPNLDMERVHVDFETFDISRKNAEEVTKAISGRTS